ncbi:T9SS type A sorting domain-containing protein [Soonwooa sp.]|uniref:T9SS type A sorting domain-containing protein n=1 Tax=Soonwooa sp. TaxID=1938592 RepID=UPI0028A79935|nr:T9SS type A sorting domain-containing protein [Soonwooa sp.]
MKKIYTVLLMALLQSSVVAQVTYTFADYANAGDQADYFLGNVSTSINFDLSGPNHQWNFSSIQNRSGKSVSYVDPNTTGYKNLWCLSEGFVNDCDTEFNNNYSTAIQLIEAPYTAGPNTVLENVYAHFNKTSTDFKLKMIGVKGVSFGTTFNMVLNYQQPDLMYKFPMNYNDAYTENFSYSGNVQPQGFNLQVSGVGTRSNTVDGFGDLTIADQAFSNVLRLKTVSDQVLTTTQNGINQQRNVKLINYQWFSPNFKYPVLDVTAVETNAGISTTEIRYLENSSTLATSSTKVKTNFIYPNPSQGNFKTNIPQNDIRSIEVYNQNGQLVSKSLNLTHLNKGNYVIKIKTSTETFTQKVIKE